MKSHLRESRLAGASHAVRLRVDMTDSIVRGADTPPLLEQTIGEALDAAIA
jgi:hypothetical protein